ncbi:MAG TPA: hypothetical protein VK673_21885 [Chthoniobacterales bacterium]|nr:hypothetical protein [Chthoniobacterales bacterium]
MNDYQYDGLAKMMAALECSLDAISVELEAVNANLKNISELLMRQ